MNSNIIPFRKTALTLAASGIFLGLAAGNGAMAQQAPAVEQITVTAPLIVEVKKPGATPAASAAAGVVNGRGTVFTVLSASSNVSFADLDLTKVSGINTLEKRINDTATATCNQLKAKYPESVYVPVKSTDCVKTATDQAMIQAFEIIAASVR